MHFSSSGVSGKLVRWTSNGVTMTMLKLRKKCTVDYQSVAVCGDKGVSECVCVCV